MQTYLEDLAERARIAYVEVGRLADFPARSGRKVQVDGWEIAIFHTCDGQYYALENNMPGRNAGRLTDGIVSGHYVYSSEKGIKVNMEDGCVLGLDGAGADVRTFPVQIEDGTVRLGIPQDAL